MQSINENKRVKKGPVNAIKRVLCIDDDAINRMVIKHILLSLEFEVDLASSGQKGLELFKEHHYDLILLDILMPELNGFETAAAIREISMNEPPIVLISAGIQDDLEEKMKANNIQFFLPKPIEKHTLHNTIQQLL